MYSIVSSVLVFGLWVIATGYVLALASRE